VRGLYLEPAGIRVRALRAVATAPASRSPRCIGGRVARRRLGARRNKGHPCAKREQSSPRRTDRQV